MQNAQGVLSTPSAMLVRSARTCIPTGMRTATWQLPTHHQQRTRAFGKIGDTLIMISGPRHARGPWTIRLFLRWPNTRPYGAAVQHDHLVTLDAALIEDARRATPQIVEDFLERDAVHAQQRRDAETLQRLASSDRRLRRADTSGLGVAREV